MYLPQISSRKLLLQTATVSLAFYNSEVTHSCACFGLAVKHSSICQLDTQLISILLRSEVITDMSVFHVIFLTSNQLSRLPYTSLWENSLFYLLRNNTFQIICRPDKPTRYSQMWHWDFLFFFNKKLSKKQTNTSLTFAQAEAYLQIQGWYGVSLVWRGQRLC